MSILRTSLIFATLAYASPAPAAVAVTLGDALFARPLAEDSVASLKATERYFDADALLTVGALALAGGALASAAHRPRRAVAALAPAPLLKPRDAA